MSTVNPSCCAMASFGLISKVNRFTIPLKSIRISSKLHGFTAEVESTMVYSNESTNPVEVMYVFPSDEEAAVCGFQATIDGRILVAKVQEKQEARDTYDDAISGGFSAFLLEESDKSSDVFQINLGNLPPGTSATVKLTFVTTLKVEEEKGIIFVLPTVMNPRYSAVDADAGVISNLGSFASVNKIYSFDFDMNVQCATSIHDITSPYHQIAVEINPDDNRQATVCLYKEHKCYHDLEVHVLCQQLFQAHALVENGVTKSATGIPDPFLSKPVIMLNFFPWFDSYAILERGEFIFIVDQSGSMSGSKIKSAKESLLLFLKSLPQDCYFNVVGFGSTFSKLFDTSEVYNDDSLARACHYVELTMDANLGGTEILVPLREVFSQSLIKGYPRQIFLLTDGEVSNTREVIELVRTNATKARCFTFGIGEGASSHLVKGIARAGRGTAEFVTAQDRLQTKVMKTLKQALQPAVKDVALTWNLPKMWTVETVPAVDLTVFRGNQLVMFGLLSRKGTPSGSSITAIEGTVTLHGHIDADGQRPSIIRHALKFSAVCGNPAETSLLLHRLCAKASIIESQGSDNHVIELSKSANVISRLTSFVAVDTLSGGVVSRPLEVPADQPVYSGTVFGLYGNLPGTQLGPKMTDQADFTGSNRYSPPPKMTLKRSRNDCLPSNSSLFSIADRPPVPNRNSSSRMASLRLAMLAGRYNNTHLSLIALQTASGAWQLTNDFAVACGKTVERFQKACPTQLYQLENDKYALWATALALAFLIENFSDDRHEWEIVASKAMRWLNRSLPAHILSYEAIMRLASRCILEQ